MRLRRSPAQYFFLLMKLHFFDLWLEAGSICHRSGSSWGMSSNMQLASGMSSPTYGHLQVMKKLVIYRKVSMGNYNHLQIPSYGKGIHHHYDGKWIGQETAFQGEVQAAASIA